MKFSAICACLAVLSISSAYEYAFSPYDATDVPVGVSMGLSSWAEFWDRGVHTAVQFAQQYINSHSDPNLLPGANMSLYFVDDAGDTGAAFFGMLALGDYCLTPNATAVNAVYGPSYSFLAINMGLVGRELHLPIVSGGATSPELSDKSLYPTFSRTIASDTFQGRILAYLVQHFGWSRVATIALDDATAAGLIAEFQKDCDLLGIEVVAARTVKQFHGPEDYTADLDLININEARIILIAADSLTAAMIFEDADSMGMIGPEYVYVGCDSWLSAPDENIIAGGLGQGAIGTRARLDTSTPEYQALDDLWSAAYNADPMNTRNTTLDLWSAFGYDAMLTIAWGLTDFRAKGKFCAENPDWEDLDTDINCTLVQYDDPAGQLLESIRSADFDGATGHVRLDPFTGDRIAEFDIMNIGDDGIPVPIGYTTATLEIMLDDDTIMWPGGVGDVPMDRPREIVIKEDLVSINVGLWGFVIAISAISFILAGCFIAYNWFRREVLIIKMSTPHLNSLSMVGVMVVLVYCSLLGIDGATVSHDSLINVCYARTWLIVLGMTLSFGPLFAKTHRIQAIFGTTKLRLVKIRDSQLFMFVGLMLLVDVAFLAIWAGVHPIHINTHALPDENTSDAFEKRRPIIEECRTDQYQYWIIALCVYKGIQLFVGALIAWQIRNVQVKAVNDSHYTGLAIYNVALISVFVVPISFALKDQPDAQFMFTSLGVWFMATAIALLMFLPKIRAIRNGETALWTGTTGGSRKSGLGDKSKYSNKTQRSSSETKMDTTGGSEMVSDVDSNYTKIKTLLRKIPDSDMGSIIEQLESFVSKAQALNAEEEEPKRGASSASSASVAETSTADPASAPTETV